MELPAPIRTSKGSSVAHLEGISCTRHARTSIQTPQGGVYLSFKRRGIGTQGLPCLLISQPCRLNRRQGGSVGGGTLGTVLQQFEFGSGLGFIKYVDVRYETYTRIQHKYLIVTTRKVPSFVRKVE